MKKFKKLFVCAATLGVVSGMSMGTAMVTTNAAVKEDAYLFIREENTKGEDAEIARFEGIGNSANTLSDGVTTASIEKDGSYSVSIDISKESEFESISEIGILQLCINGAEELEDINVEINSFKIDGNEVALSDTPVCEKSSESGNYFVDIYNTNGAKLFDRTEYQNISKIDVDFTVDGWYVEPETTTTEAATTTTEATTKKEEKTTTKKEDKSTKTTTTADDKATPPPTGDTTMGTLGAFAALSAVAVIAFRKRES